MIVVFENKKENQTDNKRKTRIKLTIFSVRVY